MSKFIIIDGSGNQLGGVSTNENEIAKIAQEKADDRGESVWYTDATDESFEAVEVEPAFLAWEREQWAKEDEATAAANAEAEEEMREEEARVVLSAR